MFNLLMHERLRPWSDILR